MQTYRGELSNCWRKSHRAEYPYTFRKWVCVRLYSQEPRKRPVSPTQVFPLRTRINTPHIQSYACLLKRGHPRGISSAQQIKAILLCLCNFLFLSVMTFFSPSFNSHLQFTGLRYFNGYRISKSRGIHWSTCSQTCLSEMIVQIKFHYPPTAVSTSPISIFSDSKGYWNKHTVTVNKRARLIENLTEVRKKLHKSSV